MTMSSEPPDFRKKAVRPNRADSLHNASLFCLLRSPKSCRCAAQTPADAGFLQAFDSKRRGKRRSAACGGASKPLSRQRHDWRLCQEPPIVSPQRCSPAPSYSPCGRKPFSLKPAFSERTLYSALGSSALGRLCDNQCSSARQSSPKKSRQRQPSGSRLSAA